MITRSFIEISYQIHNCDNLRGSKHVTAPSYLRYLIPTICAAELELNPAMSAHTRSERVAARRPHTTRSTRPTRNRFSYREMSTDNSDTASDDEPHIALTQPKRPPIAQQSTGNPIGKRKANTSRRSTYTLGAKKVKVSRENLATKKEDAILQLGGIVPPWQSLPYQILLQIFRYASYPLRTDEGESTPNVKWLLKMALLCRVFAEPALSALYWSPPLSSPAQAHGLISSLASQNKRSTFNYKAKIKYLEVEALSILTHKHRGHNAIVLAKLISQTPQLRGVDIHLLSETPMLYKAIMGGTRVNRDVYRISTISALEQSKVSLVEWKWNSSMAGVQFALPELREIHKSLPFRTLKELTLVSYHIGSARLSSPDDIFDTTQAVSRPSRAQSTEKSLAEALECLPNLKRLRFKMSSLVNEELLCLLPRNLEILEITECSNVESEMLESFLKTHGNEIRELVLDHNQALALSFLKIFATACPKAETLKMNLTYYNSHVCFSNSDPRFSALFAPNEVPTWPATLQRLELLHLRKWDIETAESFFSSLVDSAASLPQLRHLDIKASLDESGWRDRVAFRDRWVGRLERVFLRNPPAPIPYLASIDAFKAHKTSTKKPRKVSEPFINNSRPSLRRKVSRRFSHIEVPQTTVNITGESDSDSSAPLISTRRTTRQSIKLGKETRDMSSTTVGPPPSKSIFRNRRRLHDRKRLDSDSSSQDSALDDDGLELGTREASEADEKDIYIQGMCDVVHVMIDNLRPMEQQLNESNFLDEEVSGDEDWNGDNSDEGGYAW